MLTIAPMEEPLLPDVLAALRSPSEEAREEGITVLAESVTASYDAAGAELGQALRQSGGIAPIAWLLAERNAPIQQKALLVLANLCSDAVDAQSAQTKQALLAVGAERALFACLRTANNEPATVELACATLQNLCHEHAWSELAKHHGLVSCL